MEQCQKTIDQYDDDATTPINLDHCGEVMDKVSEPYQQEINGKKQCMNVYDVRLVDDWPACGMNWPPDLPDVYSFLRVSFAPSFSECALTVQRSDVVSALHAGIKDSAWVECSNRVSSELSNRESFASVQYIPGILEKGVQVLMFAGADDLICNYKGIELMCDAMTWNGETGWDVGHLPPIRIQAYSQDALTDNWYMNDTQVGTWRTSRNMTYAKVFESSHMVRHLPLNHCPLELTPGRL